MGEVAQCMSDEVSCERVECCLATLHGETGTSHRMPHFLTIMGRAGLFFACVGGSSPICQAPLFTRCELKLGEKGIVLKTLQDELILQAGGFKWKNFIMKTAETQIQFADDIYTVYI